MPKTDKIIEVSILRFVNTKEIRVSVCLDYQGDNHSIQFSQLASREELGKSFHELADRILNAKGIAIGKIYPFGNPFTLPCSKIKFDPVNYGAIAFKSNMDYNNAKNE